MEKESAKLGLSKAGEARAEAQKRKFEGSFQDQVTPLAPHLADVRDDVEKVINSITNTESIDLDPNAPGHVVIASHEHGGILKGDPSASIVSPSPDHEVIGLPRFNSNVNNVNDSIPDLVVNLGNDAVDSENILIEREINLGPPSFALTGGLDEEDEDWDDSDFVFVTQTNRRLGLVGQGKLQNNQIPSAPPLHLLQTSDSFTSIYAAALGDINEDSIAVTSNAELLHLLASYEGSQTMLDAALAKVKTIRERIQNLSETAWKLEYKMLVADEQGEIMAVPYRTDQSWTAAVLSTLMAKVMSSSVEADASPGENAILHASQVSDAVKLREEAKTQLRDAIDCMSDRAFAASLKRHLAVTLIKESIGDVKALQLMCEALMHYENRDRDVCFVSKSIRHLFQWTMTLLLDSGSDELSRTRNQVWLIRKAKRYALKSPPKSLSRVCESIDTKGATAHWISNDWIERWLVILQAIVQSSVDAISIPGSLPTMSSQSISSAMVSVVDQDEEVLMALLNNFSFDLGLKRLLETFHERDMDRFMSKVWHLEEILGAECSKTKTTCSRFSAELASRICRLLNALAQLLDVGLSQAFFDRIVIRASLFLLERGTVVDVTQALHRISDHASWCIFGAAMTFMTNGVSLDGITGQIDQERSNVKPHEGLDDLFRELVDYRVESGRHPPVSRITCLEEWLAQAPMQRSRFEIVDSHLARCSFLTCLGIARGSSVSYAVVRELLGLAYFLKAIPSEVANPLVSRILEAHPPIYSLVLHIVALNDAVFFSKGEDSVRGLFKASCKGWEPSGERDLRFLRDWLQRDPSDPRSAIACDILERLDSSTFALETILAIARMIALVSVSEQVNEHEQGSLLYQKTVRAYLKSRLLERLWCILLQMNIPGAMKRKQVSSPLSSLSSAPGFDGEVSDSDVELLALTFRQNPSQPMLAFAVGMHTTDASCLRVLISNGRLDAARQLARVISHSMFSEGNILVGCEDSEWMGKIYALQDLIQSDPLAFVKNVVQEEAQAVLDEESRIAYLLQWLRIGRPRDVDFANRILLLIPMDVAVEWDSISRFVPHAKLSTPFLWMQILIQRTLQELPIWFGIGRVLLEQQEVMPVQELFESADRVLPELLRLTAGVRSGYVTPSKLSFFDWVALLLSIDLDDAEQLVMFIPAAQFILSFVMSTGPTQDAIFGHYFWQLAPKANGAVQMKMQDAAKRFHQAAAATHNAAHRAILLQAGEISHRMAGEWLGDPKATSLAPRSRAPARILAFTESSSIAYENLLISVEFISWGSAAHSAELRTSPETTPKSGIADITGDSTPVPLSRDRSLGASMMMSTFQSFVASTSPVSSLDRNLRLVPLLKSSALGLVDSRARLQQLAELDCHQFSGLYVARARSIPVTVDRLYHPQQLTSSVSNGGQKKKKFTGGHSTGSAAKRPEITKVTWTVHERDQQIAAALLVTENKLSAEIDSLLARFAPGIASEELCEALSQVHRDLVRGGADGLATLKELFSFDTLPLCSCAALRDAWMEVVKSAIATAKGASNESNADASLFLLGQLLAQPWTVRLFHSYLDVPPQRIVEAFEMFIAQCSSIETTDAINILKRLEVVNILTDEESFRVLSLILISFGRRNMDAKLLDHMRRGLLKRSLSRYLQTRADGLSYVIRSLLRGSDDGGPLPSVVWSEVSSLSDSIWLEVPQTQAQDALLELGHAFVRLTNKRILVPSWIALAPSLCRRAAKVDIVLRAWSPWVLISFGGADVPHSSEEDPLVNCFISCLLHLVSFADTSRKVHDALLEIWLWFCEAVHGSRTTPKLVKGLQRLPWDRMTMRSVDTEIFLTSIGSFGSSPEPFFGEPEIIDHNMALLAAVLEKVAFERYEPTEWTSVPNIEVQLERAFVIGLRTAGIVRTHRLFLSMPFERLPTDAFNRTLDTFLSKPLQLARDQGVRASTDLDETLTSKVDFLLAVAAFRFPGMAMDNALSLTFFATKSIIQASISAAVTVKLFHAILSFVRRSFCSFNGDLESCIVRQLLSLLVDDASTITTGFCFAKELSSNINRAQRPLMGQANVDDTVLGESLTYITGMARSLMPTFLKSGVKGGNSGIFEGSSDSWSDEWKKVFTDTLSTVMAAAVAFKLDPALVGCGCVVRLFASGSDGMAGLFAREASTLTRIQPRALARILDVLAYEYDLTDLAEKCETLKEAALGSGSAFVVCAALHMFSSGFDRVSVASGFIAELDFRMARKDGFALVSELARNLGAANSSSLSKAYKIDRALFISARLEQVAVALVDPKERLIASACSDALRSCCNKVDFTCSAIDRSGLKGPEVDWTKQNVNSVEFDSLHNFVDQVRAMLWPGSLDHATKLTEVQGILTSLPSDAEMFVAL